ncbi:MAG: cytidine/deoxycytidylate deaminase family protein [Methanobacteriota archaeon]|nr:MAG: cytidine/deoxycytidylate deaminase family protein [Euryarchaeota archaeon]
MRNLKRAGIISRQGRRTDLADEGNRRISKDDYFMNIAIEVSRRSTCTRRQIGAIIVSDVGEIKSTGYNGNPRGLQHCEEIGCIRDKLAIPSGTRLETCTAVHAEQNALMQAGTNARNSTLYSTIVPCPICARMILNAQVARVVYIGDYSDLSGLQLLEQAGIEVVRMDSKDLDARAQR